MGRCLFIVFADTAEEGADDENEDDEEKDAADDQVQDGEKADFEGVW